MGRTMQSGTTQRRDFDAQGAVLEAAARVLSGTPYDRATLADVADAAGVDLQLLHDHFCSMDDIAASVLDVQQERMTEVLSRVMESDAPSLDRLLGLLDGVAELMAVDPLVQAGIAMVDSLPVDLQDTGHGFYEEWQKVTETLIREGVVDGSVTSAQDPAELAELLNEIFVGAQVLSGMQDRWASLPARLELAQPVFRAILVP